MRDKFPGHYSPTPEDFDNLWKTAIISLDTNILLHLFRYGEESRNAVFGTLSRLRTRLWIPYQVGLEFHRRWRDVDHKNRSAYDDLCDKLKTIGNSAKILFDEYKDHQVIDSKKEKEKIDKFFLRLSTDILEQKNKHPHTSASEKIFDEISDLIGDSVGEKFSASDLNKIYKEGEERYKNKIPPGYRDVKKEGTDKYGDLVIWKELIQKSGHEEKGIIFVTDDLKDYWWSDHKGKRIGPHPELIEEAQEATGQKFYFYSLSGFLEYSSKYLKHDVSKEAVKEIKRNEEFLRIQASDTSQNLADKHLSSPLISFTRDLYILNKIDEMKKLEHEADKLIALMLKSKDQRKISEIQKQLHEIKNQIMILDNAISDYNYVLSSIEKVRSPLTSYTGSITDITNLQEIRSELTRNFVESIISSRDKTRSGESS